MLSVAVVTETEAASADVLAPVLADADDEVVFAGATVLEVVALPADVEELALVVATVVFAVALVDAVGSLAEAVLLDGALTDAEVDEVLLLVAFAVAPLVGALLTGSAELFATVLPEVGEVSSDDEAIEFVAALAVFVVPPFETLVALAEVVLAVDVLVGAEVEEAPPLVAA